MSDIGQYPHKTLRQQFDEDNFDATIDRDNLKVNLSSNFGVINVVGSLTVNDQPISTSTNYFNELLFVPQTLVTPQEGQMYYDTNLKTFTLQNDILDSSLQLGEELWARVTNINNFTLLNGTVCYIKSSNVLSNRVTLEVDVLDVNNIDSSMRALGIITSDIPQNEDGYIVRYGAVNGIDTSQFDEGDIVYGDPENLGGLTNVIPKAPNYPVRIGTVTKKSTQSGQILVDTQSFNGTDTSNNINGMLNGIATQTQSINFIVESGQIYADVTNIDNTKMLPFIINGDLYYLDTLNGTGVNGAARIQLLQGTATEPQINYIYIIGIPDSEAFHLEASTFLPTYENTVILANVSVYDAATTITNGGVLSYRRRNNAMFNQNNDGIINEILLRLRKLGSEWESGVDPEINIGASDAVKLSAGIGWQMHKLNFEETDGTEYWVVNHQNGVVKYTNFNNINLTLDGTVLNNQIVGYEVVACLNSEGVADKCLIILPSAAYASNEANLAIYDVNNYGITSIAKNTGLSEISFRVCRVVVKRSGTVWTNLLLSETGESFQDRRGYALSTSTGGGGGGSTIITSFTDDTFEVKNLTDQTKIVQLDVSNVSTGSIRTLEVPDESGTIAIIENITTDNIINNSTLTGTNVTDVFDNVEPATLTTTIDESTDNVFIGRGLSTFYATFTTLKTWISSLFDDFLSTKSSLDIAHRDGNDTLTNVSAELLLQELTQETLGGIVSDLYENKVFIVNTLAEFGAACGTTEYTNITIIVNTGLSLSGTIPLVPKNINVISFANINLLNGLTFTGDATNLDRVIYFDTVAINGNYTISYNSSQTLLRLYFKKIISTSSTTVRNLTFQKSSTSDLIVYYKDLNNIKLLSSGSLLYTQPDGLISWNTDNSALNIKGSLRGSIFEITAKFTINNANGILISNLFPTLSSGLVSYQRSESLLLNTRTGYINNTYFSISDFIDYDSPLTVSAYFGSVRGEGYIVENTLDDNNTYIEGSYKKGEVTNSTFTLNNGAADSANGTIVSVVITGNIRDYA